MIPNDTEYLLLRWGRMSPTQFHKRLLISALRSGDQVIVRGLRITARVIAITQARWRQQL
jgi:hypothetical protein